MKQGITQDLLSVSLVKQTKQIEFKCSETFAGNIEWMSRVKSCKEINHLKWKDLDQKGTL